MSDSNKAADPRRASSLLADGLVGPGFYKLGYVTNDRERAIEHMQSHLGFEEFVRFEPEFDAVLSDGRTGHARLSCAFSAGRAQVIELMQPDEGLVDLWAAPLAGGTVLQIVFHHIGTVVDDIQQVRQAAEAVGAAPVLEASIGDAVAFHYLELPGLGHYVEHIQYRGEGDSFLRSVQSRPITRTR